MITINSLRQAYQKKQKHPVEVVRALFAAIKKQNPKINAYLTLNEPEALKQAKQTKHFNLPLSGIPLAVKDNFCTQGLRTTASSKVLNDFVPPYDATVIAKLKENGAIILGKTNMDAWAHGSSTETSDFGTTINPYDYSRVPGGSSGGSAAATALGLSPFTIGSETAGSIRQPAAWCGVVGLKPTYGRVSRYGLIAMGSSLDCPGPITRNVEDSALLLQSIAGFDRYDATSSQNPVPNYLSGLSAKKKYTIGISEDYFSGVSTEILAEFENSRKLLAKMGHKFKTVKLISPKYSISLYTILQRAEVSSNLCRYDGIRFGKDRTAFANQAKRRMMLGAFTLSVGYYDAYYLKAQKVRTLILNNFAQAFAQVDLIMAPTTPIVAPKIGQSQSNPMFGEIMDQLVEASSIAGLPGINVPIAMSDNLPVGMQIFGPQFSEPQILNLAKQYENEAPFDQFKPKQFYEI